MDDLSFIYHENLVGVADGLQPVGNHNDVFSWVSSFLFSESTFAAAAAPAQQYTLSIRNGKVNILQTAFRTAQIGKGYIPEIQSLCCHLPYKLGYEKCCKQKKRQPILNTHLNVDKAGTEI